MTFHRYCQKNIQLIMSDIIARAHHLQKLNTHHQGNIRSICSKSHDGMIVCYIWVGTHG